jgi:psiF repeat
MKLLSTVAIVAFLTAGSAFAATTPTATAGATATPASAVKRDGGMHCAKQAREKKLTGDEQAKFIKECRAARQPN